MGTQTFNCLVYCAVLIEALQNAPLLCLCDHGPEGTAAGGWLGTRVLRRLKAHSQGVVCSGEAGNGGVGGAEQWAGWVPGSEEGGRALGKPLLTLTLQKGRCFTVLFYIILHHTESGDQPSSSSREIEKSKHDLRLFLLIYLDNKGLCNL